MSSMAPHVRSDAPVQSRTKPLLGTGAGNALEWYDWNVYAGFAV